jgi:hypothetical protein
MLLSQLVHIALMIEDVSFNLACAELIVFLIWYAGNCSHFMDLYW